MSRGSSRARRFGAWTATVATILLTGPVGAAPAKRDRAAPPPPAPPAEESLSERRAVRGSPVEPTTGNESPELLDLRRFEEAAFPRPGWSPQARARDDDDAGPLPGRWRGSGDIPEVLRTPEVPRGAPAAPVARTIEPLPDSEWLRGLKLPQLPVRWSPEVVRYLTYFKNDPRGHAIMAAWLRRLGRYQARFEGVLDRLQLPRDLVYVAMVESGLESGATSRVGAGGIWQFMPGSARAYGLEVSAWVDGRRDPERATEAAARYMKDLYVRFGSWDLVFAAYNAGYGAILKSIARCNTNDFWEMCEHESGLPWESTVYVPKILAAAVVGHNREAFGLGDVEADPPLAYETVEAAPGTALATVARAAGARTDVVESLNPELIRSRTPPDRAASLVRVPVGTATEAAQALQGAKGDRVDTYVLRFGETIDDVARARGVATRELRKLNSVKDGGDVRAGTTIVVPRQIDSPTTPGPDPIPNEPAIVAVPDRVFNLPGRERVFYRTRDGDVLDEIAEAFGVRVEDLTEWNNLDPGARLHPRMILQVFVSKDFDPAGVLLLDTDNIRVVTLGSEEFLELEVARRGRKRLQYQVKEGDTLAKVARRYGLSPGDLGRINRFSHTTDLEVGQRIVVYAPTGEPPPEIAQGRRPTESARPAPALRRDAVARPRPGAPTAKSKPARHLTKAESRRGSVPTAAGKPKAAARAPAPSARSKPVAAPAGKSAKTPAHKR